MWVLDKSTKSFIAKTTVAPVTPLTFNITYKTKTLKPETDGLSYHDSGEITETYSEIVTPPYGTGIRKNITYIQVTNSNTATHEVKFAVYDDGTPFIVFVCELQSKWTVEWSEDGRWVVYDENGVKKNDNLPLSSSANAPSSVTVSSVSTSIIAANADRKGLVLINNGTKDCFLGIGTAALLNNGILLKANGGTWIMDPETFTTQAINGITSSSTTTMLIQEFE